MNCAKSELRFNLWSYVLYKFTAQQIESINAISTKVDIDCVCEMLMHYTKEIVKEMGALQIKDGGIHNP